ncbi:MAG: GNAT family N-acetyltransferase [Solobacterium sp.]|nr:GNAT family N-acetyltransferase [Solobacterium sp.]
MEIKVYTQNYEKEVVDCWNRNCDFDPIDIKRFRVQALFDDNFDPNLCLVALVDENVHGFIMATKRKFPYLERGLESDRGWINVMFVDKEYRNCGIGQQMLDIIENKLKDLGVKNITLGAYSPNYFFWGADPVNYSDAVSFFEKNNYKALDLHYSMGKELHGYKIPEETLVKKSIAQKAGYKFLNFDYKYSLELLDFLKNEFGGGWKRNALIAMQKGIAEDLILIILNPSNQICGFCMRAIDGNPMRFGPVGVSKSERNMGLGSILLDMQCFEMAKKGIYRMYFVTTDDPGKRYYERHGLSVIRTTVEYRKEI